MRQEWEAVKEERGPGDPQRLAEPHGENDATASA